MTHLYTSIYRISLSLKRLTVVVSLLWMGCAAASALDVSTYAAKSRLSSGNWVKVSVSSSGMHCIPEASLRSWGFSDPSKVKIYGYGAKRLPELLGDSYLDDLPQAHSEYVSGDGLYFYAEGPVTWVQQAENYFRPAHNPYTDYGYYFLSDSDSEPRLVPGKAGSPAEAEGAADMFYSRLYHEVDEISPGNAGFLLLGEDFKYTPSRTFNFNLPDLVESEPVRMEVSFVAYTLKLGSSLSFTVDGKSLPADVSDNISHLTDTKYGYGVEGVTRKEFQVKGNSMSVGISYKSRSTVKLANLNYIAVNYPRKLRLPSEKRLMFYMTSDQRRVRLSGASKSTRVWDVTDPQNISRMDVAAAGSVVSWQSPSPARLRTFTAWEPSGGFPAPAFVENVRSQNLHAKGSPDMVIFTPNEWRSQADRLARFHREDAADKLDVLVLTPQQIYNEFSSGCPDAQAFRKILKMFYDRGNAGSGKKLKYALFFSRPTYDPRLRTAKIRALGYPMLPAWFTDRGLNDNNSYTTDDIFAFLEDGSGMNTSSDYLSIAVGRIPATSAADAKSAVDKIISYAGRQPKGIWRNTILLTADDGDNGIHMEDIEKMARSVERVDQGTHSFFKKIYIDEFELIGGQYPDARTRFYRNLDEGAMLWVYQGHAAPSSLTAENLVNYRDLNEFYIRHWPVVMAFTCDFMRWDSPVISGAELLFNNPSGGVVAAMSATRPVYITENGHLSRAFGRELLKRDDKGMIRPIGEIYREAKNGYSVLDDSNTLAPAPTSNGNKLRYVLLADPAMRLAIPSHNIVLDEVAGRPVVPIGDTDDPALLMARQQATVKGHIEDAFGNRLTDFNGLLNATLYDAEYSVTTRGNGDGKDKIGKPVTFEQQGGRLFVGTGKVKNGEFTLNVVMPAEVADNYRPAAFNMYAYTEGGVEATGVCRDLYVYGTDPNAVPDTEAPVIESIYLNHPTFRNGQEVNSAPMLIATMTDDRSMNLSTAGVGHQMALYLDGGEKTYGDVSDYFTPFPDGTPGGTLAYPLENLPSGNHTLRLRVWDTGPNSTEASVDFVVAKEIAPTLYDVYTDVNPVSTEANFYISHDRPDRNLTVTIEVFNLMGRPLWQATETGRSDMFTSMPLTWDLHDEGGRRVPRGIYLYRATISDDDSGEKTSTAARKLAVTGL